MTINRHVVDAIATAVSLIGRAVAHDEPAVHSLADEVARGDSTRESFAVLAYLAGGLIETLAAIQHKPVDEVFGDLAGAAARDMTLLDEETS